MKRKKLIVLGVSLVLFAGILFATDTYNITVNAIDQLLQSGARVERAEYTTAAAVGQAASTLAGRAGVVYKVTRIIQKPTASINNTLTLSLVTRGGDTYELYALTEATHSEVRVDDLEQKVYYANGADAAAQAKTFPIWIRNGETLSMQGITNCVNKLVVEYLVIPEGRGR